MIADTEGNTVGLHSQGRGAGWRKPGDGGCLLRPARRGGGRGARRRDYRCGACGEAFALDDQPPYAHVVCPACGSTSVREHWESRVRNAGRTTWQHVEELRDRPG